MQRAMIWLHPKLARLVLVVLLIQVYLAGAGIFGAFSFEAHRMVGYGMEGAALLLLVLAAIGRLGRAVIGFTAALLVLSVVQATLPSMRDDLEYVAAVHPLLGLGLMGIADAIARRGEQRLAASTGTGQPVGAGTP
jgi:hypothetical protein